MFSLRYLIIASKLAANLWAYFQSVIYQEMSLVLVDLLSNLKPCKDRINLKCIFAGLLKKRQFCKLFLYLMSICYFSGLKFKVTFQERPNYKFRRCTVFYVWYHCLMFHKLHLRANNVTKHHSFSFARA